MFRATQNIKGGTALSNWAHVCMSRDGCFAHLFFSAFPQVYFLEGQSESQELLDPVPHPCAVLGLPMCTYNITFLFLFLFCFLIR